MHLHRISMPLLVFAALSGSASVRAAGQTTPAPPPNDRAAAMAAAGSPIRWQAMLQATHQRTAIVAPMIRNRTTGTIFIAQAGAERARVRLAVSTTRHDGSPLQWAIVPGRCGSNMMPITSVERFPILDIGADGRGELDMELALTMPATGQFHVNVYRGGTQLNNVLTCGNLTRGK